MIKKAILITFIIIDCIFIISCNNSNNKNKSLIVSVGGAPSTLDPAFAKGIPTAVYLTHTFETLTQRDEKGNIIPALAYEWISSNNNTLYTFKLRDNAKWSDGQNVTAYDFVYALKRLIDPKIASPFSMGFDVIKNAKKIMRGELNLDSLGVKALDKHTLQIELEVPLPYFEEAMSSDIASPVREDIIKEYGANWWKKNLIGNGPYIIKEYDENFRIVMEKNPHYWDKDNVRANTIIFEFLEDVNTAVAAIYTDSILFYPDVPENDKSNLINKKIAKEVDTTSVSYYLINLNKYPFNNKLVRKALALAINRDYITKNVLGGGRVSSDGFVPINVKNGNVDFRANANNYFSLEDKDYNKNIELSKELLKKAGFENIKKFPIIELITTTNPTHTLVAESIQHMYKTHLGIDLKIRYEEGATYLDSIKNGNFQMITASTSVAYNQATGYLRLFQINGLGNVGGYSNTIYDYLVDIAITNANKNIREKAAFDAERILIDEDMAIIPLYYDKATIMQNKHLKGVKYDIFGIYDFRNSYIE